MEKKSLYGEGNGNQGIMKSGENVINLFQKMRVISQKGIASVADIQV